MSSIVPLLVIRVNRLSAVFWDVDGTLADTEMDGHRPAFNSAFKELDLTDWDEALYNRLLAIPGGLRRVKLHAEHCGIELSHDQRCNCVIASGCIIWNASDRARKAAPRCRRLLAELNSAGVQQWIVTTSGLA